MGGREVGTRGSSRGGSRCVGSQPWSCARSWWEWAHSTPAPTPAPLFSPCPATGEVLLMVLEGSEPQGLILLCPHPAAGGVPVPAEPTLPIVPRALTHRSRCRLGRAHLLQTHRDVSTNPGAGPAGAPQLMGTFCSLPVAPGIGRFALRSPSAPAALRLSPGWCLMCQGMLS